MLSATLIFSRPSMIAMSLVCQRAFFLTCAYSYSPPSTRPSDHVEIIARLRRVVWIDGLHELLEDHQGRQATDAAAVEREQAELVGGHGGSTTTNKVEIVERHNSSCARWENGVVYESLMRADEAVKRHWGSLVDIARAAQLN
jgi:hypothetical protein